MTKFVTREQILYNFGTITKRELFMTDFEDDDEEEQITRLSPVEKLLTHCELTKLVQENILTPFLESKFWQNYREGILNIGLMTSAFTAYNLVNELISKQFATTWESFWTLYTGGTFIVADVGGALGFNLMAMFEMFSELNRARNADYSKLRIAVPAVVKYLYEISASTVAFIPFSVGIEIAAITTVEPGNIYTELGALTIKALGCLATVAVLSHLKSYLKNQELSQLYISLLITSYSSNIHEAINLGSANPVLETTFDALATPLIATIPTTVVPAIYHPVAKLCNWMKSTWDSWTDVPEDELEVVNGSDCYMRWC